MAFTRDGVATGHFMAEVFAWGRYTFVPRQGGETIIYDHDEQLTIGTLTPTPFFIRALYPGRTDPVIVDDCCNMCELCVLRSCSCHCASL